MHARKNWPGMKYLEKNIFYSFQPTFNRYASASKSQVRLHGTDNKNFLYVRYHVELRTCACTRRLG